MRQVQSVLRPGNPGENDEIRVRTGQLEDDVGEHYGASVDATATRRTSTLRSCTRRGLARWTGKYP